MIRTFVTLLAFGSAQTTVQDALDRLADPNRAVTTQPLPSLFSTSDYPADAIRKGEQGTSVVRLTIDTAGRVTKCDVVNSSGSALLDQTTCNVLQQRARFAPARNAEGHRVIDQTTVRIRWELPGMPVEEQYVRAIFRLDDSKQSSACSVEASGKVDFDCKQFEAIKREFLSRPDHVQAEELVIEMGMRLDSDHLLSIGKGRDQLRLILRAYTLTIDPSGKVIDCQPALPGPDVERERAACEGARLQNYARVPSGQKAAPRLLTTYSAIYLRGAWTPPKLTNFDTLFSSDDYPADALASGREGTSTVKVAVEADGRPTGCQIVVSAGWASLDSEACKKIMAAGKFEPGLDLQGRPYRANLIRRVNWELPVSPIRDSFVRALLKLGSNGSVESCSVEGHNDGGYTCEEAKTEAELALKSADASNHGILVVETGELIGDGESVENLGSGRGQSPWYISAVTLEIDASGKVINCRPTFDWMKDEWTQLDCDDSRSDKFEPLPIGHSNRSSRYFTRYELIYFRN